MKPNDLRITDVHRILFGTAPFAFFVEALGRTALIYIVLVVAMRFIGQRMSSSSTRNELAALVSLAAAFGPAMLGPDRGLLPAILISAVILMAHRVMAIQTFRSPAFEQQTQGIVTTLVRDGELELAGMRSVPLSRERVFAMLRSRGVQNLGRVERLYLETNGAFSAVLSQGAREGLSILPGWDVEFIKEQPVCEGRTACASCGHIAPTEDVEAGAPRACVRCGAFDWRPAILC